MKPNGRPTLYDEKYCDKIIAFFDVPHIITVTKTKVDKDGNKFEYEVERANSLPTFEKFAVSIGMHRETLINWTENNPKFFDAYKKAKDLQKDMLIDLGMLGLYNAPFTQFVAKNITDMRDRQEIDSTSVNSNANVNVTVSDIQEHGKSIVDMMKQIRDGK